MISHISQGNILLLLQECNDLWLSPEVFEDRLERGIPELSADEFEVIVQMYTLGVKVRESSLIRKHAVEDLEAFVAIKQDIAYRSSEYNLQRLLGAGVMMVLR